MSEKGLHPRPCCVSALPDRSVGRDPKVASQPPAQLPNGVYPPMVAQRPVRGNHAAATGGCRRPMKRSIPYCICFRYGYGLTAAPPPGWISKCRCGALAEALPVLPTYPITWPALTRPEVTAYLLRCA